MKQKLSPLIKIVIIMSNTLLNMMILPLLLFIIRLIKFLKTIIFKKTNDGIVYQIICPDKNEIFSFTDRNSGNVIVIIKNIEGGLFKVNENINEVIVFTPNEYVKLNGEGKLEDVLYNNEIKGGCYYGDLNVGKIWTKHDEENLFEIYDVGNAYSKVKEKKEEEEE